MWDYANEDDILASLYQLIDWTQHTLLANYNSFSFKQLFFLQLESRHGIQTVLPIESVPVNCAKRVRLSHMSGIVMCHVVVIVAGLS